MPNTTLPPGPRGIALFRPLYHFTHQPLDFIISTQRKYGDTARFRFLKFPVYFFNRPSLIEEILITQSAKFIKSADLREGNRVLGNGLLTSEGEFWRRQRNLAQPAFHRERVMAYAPVMTGYAEQMLETWRDGETCEIRTEMMQAHAENCSQDALRRGSRGGHGSHHRRIFGRGDSAIRRTGENGIPAAIELAHARKYTFTKRRRSPR